jgi:predicted lipid carrier protein YhbT
MQFLSAEWLAALDEAARDLEVEDDTSILIEQRIRTDPTVEVVWHTRVAAGVVRFISGPAPDADIRLSCDQETALALTQGRLSAPRAFLDGRLHLDGDVSALMGARSGLDAMADVFALVRADTAID